jgi:hypothetical protein
MMNTPEDNVIGLRNTCFARTSCRVIAISLMFIMVAGVNVLGLAASQRPADGAANRVTIHDRAPNGMFTTVDGDVMSISSLRGHPALIWFVVTWGCVSCDASTQSMAQHLVTFSAHHVRVVELELAGDLGQPGPTMAQYRLSFGSAANNPDWIWGTASKQLTTTYDPVGILDQYYLINGSGRIVLTGRVPASNIPSLVVAVKKFSTSSTH